MAAFADSEPAKVDPFDPYLEAYRQQLFERGYPKTSASVVLSFIRRALRLAGIESPEQIDIEQVNVAMAADNMQSSNRAKVRAFIDWLDSSSSEGGVA